MHIVRAPAPPGQGADPPARRRTTTLTLTEVETMRLRAALRNLKGLFGSWPCLAAVMATSETNIRAVVAGRKPGSHRLAMLAAKAAGLTVERLLGALASADVCPTCGTVRGVT